MRNLRNLLLVSILLVVPLPSKNNFAWPPNIKDARGLACKVELTNTPAGVRWYVQLAIKFDDVVMTRIFAIREQKETTAAVKDCAVALKSFNKAIK